MIAVLNLGKEKMKYLEVEIFAHEKRKEGKQEKRVIVERAVRTSQVIVVCRTFYFVSYFLRPFIQFDSFKISEVGKPVY